MSELIVVGITEHGPHARSSPTHVKKTNPDGNFNFLPAAVVTILKFIETELIPDPEKRYPRLPYRILAGHSLAAVHGAPAMLSRPELFNLHRRDPALNWTISKVKRAEDFSKRERSGRTLYSYRPRTGPD